MKKRFLVTLLLVAMILAIVPPQTVQAAEQGRLWEDEYGDKYYIYGNGHDEPGGYRVYVDGKYYDFGGGWQQIGGKWYFFEEETGRAYTSKDWHNGIYEIYGKHYAFDDKGVMKSNGWISNDDNSLWYYAGSDGALLGRGWKSIGGKWYYFDGWNDGYGSVRTEDSNRIEDIDGKRYGFNSSGALMTGGWISESWSWETDDGTIRSVTEWYYANKDGTLAEGWRYIGGKWYYFLPGYGYMVSGGGRKIDGQYYVFNKDGALAGAGWVDLGDGWWGYANANGKPVPGWKKSGNSWYFIMESGVAATAFAIADKTLNFFKENGVWESSYKTPGWKSVKRGEYTYWFYINPDGTAATGWKAIKGKWYFFNERTGMMEATGATEIDGKIYMFDDNGNLITKAGWYEDKREYGSYWYYLNKDGSCRTGWQNIGGKRYYFYEYGSMYGGDRIGTMEIDGKVYLFDADGSLITKAGWFEEKTTYEDEVYTNWYYLNSDGTCRIGWQKIGGKWYYFHGNGEMLGGSHAGVYPIDGVRYYFDENGAMRTGWIKETDEWEDYEGNIRKNDYWYYADASGAMATGERTIGGKKYLFSEYGNMHSSDYGEQARYKGMQYTLSASGEITKSFNYQALYK